MTQGWVPEALALLLLSGHALGRLMTGAPLPSFSLLLTPRTGQHPALLLWWLLLGSEPPAPSAQTPAPDASVFLWDSQMKWTLEQGYRVPTGLTSWHHRKKVPGCLGLGMGGGPVAGVKIKPSQTTEALGKHLLSWKERDLSDLPLIRRRAGQKARRCGFQSRPRCQQPVSLGGWPFLSKPVSLHLS